MTNIDSKPIAISLLGLPGSGKGTQADFLSEKIDATLLSIGELVRDALESFPDDGTKQEALDKYNHGIPQDDDFIKKIILEKLAENEGKNIVFDNYPFSKRQIEDFLDILKSQNIERYLLLNIKIDKTTALKRITHRVICSKCGESYIDFQAKDVCSKCGEKLTHRSDDKEDIVSKRIDEYMPRISEVSSYFAEKGVNIEIDGEKTPDEVREEVNTKMEQWNS